MKYVVRDAPDGIRAQWFVSDNGDVLIIEIGRHVDKFSRRQYIDQALDEYGIESRRRGLPLLLPVVGGGHAAWQGKVVTNAMIVGSGAVAVGIVASAIVPIILSDGHRPATHRPPIAAPAPTQPGPPAHNQPPMPSPSKRRSQRPGSAAPSDPTGLSVQAAPVSVTDHARIPSIPGIPGIPGLPLSHPQLSTSPSTRVPLPVTRQKMPLLAVPLPLVGARVWVSPRLSVRVRLGGTRLGLRP